jgi:hypothetical protein
MINTNLNKSYIHMHFWSEYTHILNNQKFISIVIYCSYSFLTSALDGGEVASVTNRPLYLRERTPGTLWIGGWVDPRADKDKEATGKILCLCRGCNHHTT